MTDEAPAAPQGKIPAGSFRFVIPDADRQLETDPKTFSIQLLLLGHQMDAERSAEAKKTSAVWEIVKHCLVGVDDKPISWDGAAKEVLLEALSPRARSRIAQAVTRLQIPDPAGDDSFFDSMTVTV